MPNPRLPYLVEKVKKLPYEPGVYIMRDKSGTVIYVGKAKALRNRVSSYFHSVEKHLEKVYSMVMNVYDFDYIVTDSEFEALVLECSMIKQYNPKYNILLKDDKGYHYIRIYPPKWSRITAEKQRDEAEAQYIGPYMSSYVVRETVDEVNRAFQLPTCGKQFPQDFRKGRPCLNFHIKQCMGVCTGKISAEEYQEVLDQALDFIKGGSNETMKLLQQRMEQAAENLDFEKAARYRDRIRAIERIHEHQKVIFTKADDLDAVAAAQNGDTVCIVLLKIRQHRLVDKQEFMIGQSESLEQARREFLLRYYTGAGGSDVPKTVALDGDCLEMELIARFLREKLGKKVELTVPARGDLKKLVEMARNNASQRLSHETAHSGREIAALDELARLLGLPHPPEYIEAYDISNIGSDTVVAGMVVYENARPLKSAYRKFAIQTVVGTDDYASMREVLTRRFRRYHEEQELGTPFARLPDLILLDGGAGHLSAALPVLAEAGVSVPVFGMVKDNRHKTRAIAATGGEIAISSYRSAFTLVSAIQEEVHRYSIQYSRSKHQKSSFELALTQVPGIGPGRAKALYRKFKTRKAMEQATLEELCAAEGMTKPAAEHLYEFLHQPEGEA